MIQDLIKTNSRYIVTFKPEKKHICYAITWNLDTFLTYFKKRLHYVNQLDFVST